MSEVEISGAARQRHENDIARQRGGVLKHVLREDAGMHDFRPGDTELTPADQAAFDARLKATQRREDSQKPRSLWQRAKGAIGL